MAVFRVEPSRSRALRRGFRRFIVRVVGDGEKEWSAGSSVDAGGVVVDVGLPYPATGLAAMVKPNPASGNRMVGGGEANCSQQIKMEGRGQIGKSQARERDVYTSINPLMVIM